jgi:hypothetical protein
MKNILLKLTVENKFVGHPIQGTPMLYFKPLAFPFVTYLPSNMYFDPIKTSSITNAANLFEAMHKSIIVNSDT